ncbi:hypothetical protein ABZ419_23510 [Streptomyces cinnamoneus]|uniref:hypothetical protein n=1 Tax=Streptomyces cinnamoneus TaxID=53446 RepID=UPI0033DA20CF
MKRIRQRAATAAVLLAAGLGLTAAQAHAGQAAPRAADYQAIAHPVAGHLGETVDVELGVRNAGPGPAATGGRAYEVTAPEGTTIVSAAAPDPARDGGQRCAESAGRSGTYLCTIGEEFAAGDRETLRFRVRIDEKVENAEGWVRVVDPDGEPDPDPDPGNDSAPIRVEVTDAAPTPRNHPAAALSGTLLLAATSGTALSAGAIALGLRRRED